MNKKIITFLLLTGIMPCSFAQQADTLITKPARQKPNRPAQRNVLWFTPTRAQKINGISFGSIPSSAMYKNDSLQVRGFHAEANPIMLFVIPHVFIHSFRAPFANVDTVSRYGYRSPDSLGQTKSLINGVNISLLGSVGTTTIKGLSISSLTTSSIYFRGLSVALLSHSIYDFRGLLISGFVNDTNKGSGLQVALFNRCRECKGVQIGLLNKMGKRTLPIINMKL